MNGFYALADALGIQIKADWESSEFAAGGSITGNFGFFTQKVYVESVSYIMDHGEGRVSFLLAASPGDLGFYVEFVENSSTITLCPIDMSRLPNRGHALFEDKTVLDTGTGRWELSNALNTTKLDGYLLGGSQGHWRAGCLDLSSGQMTLLQPQES